MDKETIRRNGRAQRLRMEDSQVEKLSRQILTQVKKSVDWSLVRSVHIYSAAGVFKEPQTRPVLEFVWQYYPAVKTYVPRMIGTTMQVVCVDAKTEFELNMREIPEPVDVPASDVSEFDLIVVPLLAFDPQLNRIGYGGGYYDRFLASFPNTPTLGLAYEQDKVELIKPDEHDIPLSMVATESKLYNRAQSFNDRAKQYAA